MRGGVVIPSDGALIAGRRFSSYQGKQVLRSDVARIALLTARLLASVEDRKDN
jgi:hypothetical protein